jgi:hypothetical protein
MLMFFLIGFGEEINTIDFKLILVGRVVICLVILIAKKFAMINYLFLGSLISIYF